MITTKIKLAAVTLAGLILFLGCIPSLQPFYTADEIIFEPSLVGTFHEIEGDGIWSFTKANDHEYRVTIKNGAKNSAFVGHLFKVGKDRFIDLYPIKESLDDTPREDFLKSSLVPGHIALRIPSLPPTLALQVMEEDEIKQFIKAKKDPVPHTFIEADRLVFTGTSEQMSAFLKRIAAEEKLWGKPGKFSSE